MPTVTELKVNGKIHAVNADGERSLLSVLRDDLNLTGSKYGCGEGECGACTVLVKGAPVRSCVTRVGRVGNDPVTTIEGLAEGGKLHPLQQAFLDADAMQCGYCTTGMIMAGVAFLRSTKDTSMSQIIQAMDENICRCGTYPRIVQAIRKAADAMKEAGR